VKGEDDMTAPQERIVHAAELAASFLRGDVTVVGSEPRRDEIELALTQLIDALDAAEIDCDLEDGGDDELSCDAPSSQFANWRLTFRTFGDGNSIDMRFRPPDVRRVDVRGETLRIVRERDRRKLAQLRRRTANFGMPNGAEEQAASESVVT
jgi:hypothetical protein